MPSAFNPYNNARFVSLLQHCVQNNASDLHLKSKAVPKARINLDIVPIAEFSEPTAEKEINDFFTYLLALNPVTEKQAHSHFLEKHWTDFSFKLDDVASRGAAYLENNGLAIVVRFFYKKNVSLKNLGMEHVIPHLDQNSVLILLTGPTGSGKTTLAAAMLEHLNTNFTGHIATMEDPIEYVLEERAARVTQRSIPAHVLTFSDGLKSMLRQDPDIVFVGEIRDTEVLREALSAAESGHLVLSTLHASSVVDCYNRIFGLFEAADQKQVRNRMASMFNLIINQRLIRGADRHVVLVHELFFNSENTKNTIRGGELSGLNDNILTNPKMVHWDKRLIELFEQGKLDKPSFEANVRDKETADRMLQQRKAANPIAHPAAAPGGLRRPSTGANPPHK